jgi:hypothetical protein
MKKAAIFLVSTILIAIFGSTVMGKAIQPPQQRFFYFPLSGGILG